MNIYVILSTNKLTSHSPKSIILKMKKKNIKTIAVCEMNTCQNVIKAKEVLS